MRFGKLQLAPVVGLTLKPDVYRTSLSGTSGDFKTTDKA
jgi:hypothetical protein